MFLQSLSLHIKAIHDGKFVVVESMLYNYSDTEGTDNVVELLNAHRRIIEWMNRTTGEIDKGLNELGNINYY